LETTIFKKRKPHRELPPSTVGQKAAALRQSLEHTSWRETHVKFCPHYPDGVCEGSHALLELWEVELDDDCNAFVCESKVAANWRKMGFHSDPVKQARYHMENALEVFRKNKEE
jgi:hypothetical protein